MLKDYLLNEIERKIKESLDFIEEKEQLEFLLDVINLVGAIRYDIMRGDKND